MDVHLSRPKIKTMVILLPVGAENICSIRCRPLNNDNKIIKSPMCSSAFIVILIQYFCFNDQWKPPEMSVALCGMVIKHDRASFLWKSLEDNFAPTSFLTLQCSVTQATPLLQLVFIAAWCHREAQRRQAYKVKRDVYNGSKRHSTVVLGKASLLLFESVH